MLKPRQCSIRTQTQHANPTMAIVVFCDIKKAKGENNVPTTFLFLIALAYALIPFPLTIGWRPVDTSLGSCRFPGPRHTAGPRTG